MPDPMALAASEKDLDEKAQMETTQNRIVEKAMRKRRKKPIQKKAAGLSQTEQMDIMNQNIVDRALKKKRKGKSKKRGSVKKVAADCAERLIKLGGLPGLVQNVQQNATYGQSALQGLPTSSTLPVRTDSGNGWSDRKPGGREKTAETIAPGQGLSQGIDLAPGVDRSQINEQVKDMLTPGNLGALLGVGGGVGGALGGFGLGGLAGGLYGALAPGKDEEGNQRSRLRQALLKGLTGAGAGGLVGGAAGALAGGGMGAGMGDAFQANPEGASQVLQTHPDNMAAPPPGQNKVIEAMLPPEYIANRPTTNMLKNLLAGTAVGGLGGAMYGGLAPGRDEEGHENDSLVQAAKYGLLGAGAGALGGGLYGKAHEAGGEGGALALEDLGKKHWQKSQSGLDPLPLFEPSRATGLSQFNPNDRWT